MRCLYEVLDVEQDADDAAIKLAYRKGALRWHPDKNQDNLKEAEERFKELQNAYEVLSDKHERAWYDSHRADILRGGGRHQAGGDNSGFAQGQPPPDEPNLYPFFSSACFSGYADGPTGFYGVYEGIFQQLAKQEAEAAQQQASGGGGGKQRGDAAAEAPPLFGASATPYPQVAAFYSHWLAFATCKDFAWADVYNLAAAPNRKVRRLMEADNLKARRAKRREFNETVRELAAFARKRDKRVAAHQAQQAQLRLEREEQERLRQERERRERAQRAREYEAAAWAQAEAEGLESEAEAALGDVPEELYCAACDKSFRSEGAFANHERSKKHLERVEVLRQLLEEEEAAAAVGESDQEPELESTSGGEAEPAAAAAGAGERRGKKNKKAKKKAARARASGFAADEPVAAARSESDAEAPAEPPVRAAAAESDDSASASEAGEEDMLEAMLRAAQQTGAAERSDVDGSDAESGASAASAAEPPPLHGAQSGEESDAADGMAGLDLRGDGPPVQQPAEAVKKKGKSKKEKRRQAARAEAHVRGQPATVDEPSATQCSVCGAEFASRTKLFAHIKEAGHAAFKA